MCLIIILGNGLHMACGGFEALFCPPKPKLATERKPCWKLFTAISYMPCCSEFFISYPGTSGVLMRKFPVPLLKLIFRNTHHSFLDFWSTVLKSSFEIVISWLKAECRSFILFSSITIVRLKAMSEKKLELTINPSFDEIILFISSIALYLSLLDNISQFNLFFIQS